MTYLPQGIDATSPFLLPVGKLLPRAGDGKPRQQMAPGVVREFDADTFDQLAELARPWQLTAFVERLGKPGEGEGVVQVLVQADLVVVVGRSVREDLAALDGLVLNPTCEYVAPATASGLSHTVTLPDGREDQVCTATVAAMGACETGQPIPEVLRQIEAQGGNLEQSLEWLRLDLVDLVAHGGAYLGRR